MSLDSSGFPLSSSGMTELSKGECAGTCKSTKVDIIICM